MAQHGYLREWDEGFGSDGREGAEREWRSREQDRGFMFGDEDREQRGPNERDEGRRGLSGHPDDHYLSWRRKQIDALDRDYADYCRERERQFHHDFDRWRSQRQSSRQPLQTGMTQTAQPVMDLDETADSEQD